MVFRFLVICVVVMLIVVRCWLGCFGYMFDEVCYLVVCWIVVKIFGIGENCC